MSNQTIKSEAYEVIEDRAIEDLNSRGIILRHKRTGARLTILSNDDENKVFYIAFRTPPTDSTGVAHILEHSVLCGSREFPVKDPFIELAKGSLNTFLNAMTYPDKTVYPVASCNDKDFANLMHVYLDAVFYPNIYQEEKIFMQEGWHYDMAAPEDELTINGVVYNEMKGAYSTPDDIVEKEILSSLYPDTAYGCESGGDPDIIPTLTYEQFLDFHRRYYHPSNSYIYLYGNMDIEEKLAFLDEYYLSHFDELSIDSAIDLQEKFAEPRILTKEYPVMEGEDLKNSTYLTYNICMGTSTDAKLYIALQVLDYALCTAQGAPLKQALLDRRIGKDVYSVMETGILQPYFCVIAKDAEAGQQEEFVQTIESVLADLAAQGIDKKALAAGINYYEFRYREADFGSYPKGLMMGLQAMDSWLYDDRSPFMHIEANHTFTLLKGAMSGNYFEELIRQYLIGNTHKSILKVMPKAGLTAVKDAKLKAELAGYKETLDQEQTAKIIDAANDLEAYQEEPSSLEDLQKIPLLAREDIRKEAVDFVNEVRDVGGTTLLFHDIFTNGIGYLKFIFDIKKLPQELIPYLGLLKTALSLVDTENYSFTDLNNEINIWTGGIQGSVNTYVDAGDITKFKAVLEIKVKFMYENMPKVFELVKEILLHSRFQDSKRLYEIIAETKSKMENAMSSSSHSLAMIRALSYFSQTAGLTEQITGIPQYRLLKDLEECFDEKKSDLIHKLETLVTYLFREENLMVDYTATAEGCTGLSEHIAAFRKELYKTPIDAVSFMIDPQKKNEGFMTAGQVQYVCRAGNFITKGLPFTGALRVLKVMMGYDYLWNQVRVKGGAYGCMCGFTKSGDSYFVSYRDPNLGRTIDVYEKAAAYIKNFQGDERSITQFVIGAISDLDLPMTPAAKGSYSLSGYMTGLTLSEMQRNRDELLGVDQDVLRGLYRYVEAFMKDGCLCVVGSEEVIRENNKAFMKTEPLF